MNHPSENASPKNSSTTFEAFSFSPCGRYLANSPGDYTIVLRDATTGEELRRLRGHGNHVNNFSFSPDGQRLASACKDGTVKIWDCASGRELLTLRFPGEDVMSVVFSPNGRWLAAGSKRDSVRLWDAGPGFPNRELPDEAVSQ